MTSVERYDIFDYSPLASGGQRELVCAFFWSPSLGVTCSDADQLELLRVEGIATPPEGAPVFPRDGRAFFDAIPFRFSGLLRAEKAAVPNPPHIRPAS
jgi:hypothetical protein